VRKLDIAPGHHWAWLQQELGTHFDYECAETITQLRNAPRAITREGQVKHSGARHEKDDRRRVDDRSRWALGFDNKEKLELYKERAAALGAALAQVGVELDELRAEGDRQQTQLFTARRSPTSPGTRSTSRRCSHGSRAFGRRSSANNGLARSSPSSTRSSPRSSAHTTTR
jgi:hypothetical protein